MATASERIRQARERRESDLWLVSDAPYGSVDLITPQNDMAQAWLNATMPGGIYLAGSLAVKRPVAEEIVREAENDMLVIGREILVSL